MANYNLISSIMYLYLVWDANFLAYKQLLPDIKHNKQVRKEHKLIVINEKANSPQTALKP